MKYIPPFALAIGAFGFVLFWIVAGLHAADGDWTYICICAVVTTLALILFKNGKFFTTMWGKDD